MFLDRELYKELKGTGNLLTDVNAFIKADPQHPMRGTASWFATEVTEEVKLPGNLKEKGTIRQGFITHWKDAN